MGTILDKIIAEKMKVIEDLKQRKDELKDLPARKKRSFLQKLEAANELAIIAEFKRASPSKGDINIGLDPREQASSYVKYGADTISVLTDGPFFKGSYADLTAVREVIDAPILCKDFIVDPIQIDFAKKAGADLILLIAAALEEEKLIQLYQYALEQDLEVLIEVHNEEEAEKTFKTGTKLIGVNNRNLKTFDVSLEVTEKLAPSIKSTGAFLISESGMKTIDDVKRVVKAGANGILVGETFMRASDLEKTLTEMKLPLVRV
ncbi:indole-3-glycerol phosphate synthase TrpC [Bacillus sp. 03113]|uniref:indole-3-glycerol phosphate synthase TrpC n=1 Tax=Bacillus sp. 03113 TaxID=2578211 RepID=UPI001142B272|nr:indole-3-glycerol phosphate synthase TrpC [Bacillus sp. 03113]